MHVEGATLLNPMTTTKAAYEAFAAVNLRQAQNLTPRELSLVPQFETRPPAARRVPSIASRVDLAKRSYRTYSSKELIRVVGVFFGSTSDFRYPRKSVTEVAAHLRMPWSTVQRILKKFEAGGRSLEALTFKKPRSFGCIPDDIKRILLSQDML